ncbi:alanine racemase [Solimicrobium silvestre]|uniref:Alanine racemase n=1 Tax=Solimicrobium silvestre TaxID=2099400 RepID=A0A2S9GUX6_9BURK|nr:alanine racemase [Solimicrobium silvestre]PRC91513.1 alr: alanine racemase [Solimicrobium silvestre]
MPRPITATIHLSALTHNYAIARQHGGAAKIWAVVKANAYGHGLAFARQAFDGADGLALVEVDYAVKLREMGWNKPIMLLEGFFHASDLPLVQQHQIDIAVHCFEQIELLEKANLSADVIKVHLKVNGGMNRLGFQPADIPAAYQRLCAIQAVRVVELMMHFANADDEFNPRLPVAEQLRRFEVAQASLGEVKLEISLSNSAANLLNTSIRESWVRAGIMLYGGSPSSAAAADFGLLPGMTLRSELIAIQEIQAGDAVGYGSRFVASKPMRIGVVACGYADGYPRHAVDGTPVLVSGVRTCLVGRVSMDMITVDVTDVADARVGSEVVLWGRGLPIDEVAFAAGTIGYELMCAVAQRVQLIVED